MAQVSSYNVANRTGAQVRADINDIYDAIKTCNSGTSDPSSPVKFMLYGDSAVGDDNLKIYDGSQFRTIGKVTEDNLGLLPKAGGTMGGALLVDSGGTESAPAIAFSNDTDTGLYRVSSNVLGISCFGGTSTNEANFEFSSNSFFSRQDITITKVDTSDAILNVLTGSDTKAAYIDLSTSTQATNAVGFDFGLRLFREAGVDGNSLLHHRSDSATAQNLIIRSQATTSGGILFQTGGTPNSNSALEVDATTRGAIAANGTIFGGKDFSIDPVSASGDKDSGMRLLTAATSAEYDGFGMAINAKSIVGIFNRTHTTGTIVEFKYNGSVVGSVSTNQTSVTYNTSSDYRLKQDINNIDDAITKIKTLRPVTFRWKNNVDIGYDSGFIAHEVQETGHYNHLVTGVKDGTRTSHSNPEENEPDYQGVDYSKFTPMLVAALQEAVAKIETLETKVAALEAS